MQNKLGGGGWSLVEIEMSWMEVDGGGWRWVEMNGAGWSWVHKLVILDKGELGARFSNTR